MRRARLKKIKKYCGDMIGCKINFEDFEHWDKVQDQAVINDNMYLLTEDQNGKNSIYKIIKPSEYVKLSNKRIWQNRMKFSNHALWRHHATIEIDENGTIVSVKHGTWLGPYSEKEIQKMGDTKLILIET